MMTNDGPVTDGMNFNNQYRGTGADGNTALIRGDRFVISKNSVDHFSSEGKNKSTNNISTRANLENGKFNVLIKAMIEYGTNK